MREDGDKAKKILDANNRNVCGLYNDKLKTVVVLKSCAIFGSCRKNDGYGKENTHLLHSYVAWICGLLHFLG
jgi:hypothetical protein